MSYSLISSDRDNKPLWHESTLRGLFDVIDAATPCSAKDQQPAFMGGRYNCGDDAIRKEGKKGYRFNENVIEMGVIPIDYDKEEPGAWEKAVKKLEDSGLEYIMYTSASHTCDKPRFRIVLSLSKAAKPFQLEYYVDYIAALLDLDVDACSYDINRLFYYGGITATAKDHTRSYEFGQCLDYLATDAPNVPNLTVVKKDLPVATQYSQEVADIYLSVLPNTVEGRDKWVKETGGFNYAGCSDQAIADWSAKYDSSEKATSDCAILLASYHDRAISDNAQAMLKARFEQVTHNTADDFDVVLPPTFNADTNRFPIVDSNEYMRGYNNLSWIVKRLLPRAQLGVVYGASGSGKTFWMLHFAATISRGDDFLGKRSKAAAVCYVASEAKAGIMKRLAGFDKEHGATKNLQIISNAPNLLDDSHATDIILSVLAQPVIASVIIIDTLAASHNGDENTATDMGRIITLCKHISNATKALVMLVHHTGKNDEMRGSSSLFAAADVVIRIAGNIDGRTAIVEKQKDGEILPPMGFVLHQTTLPETDEDGEAITTCVVQHCDVLPETSKDANYADIALIVFNRLNLAGNKPSDPRWMDLSVLSQEACFEAKRAKGKSPTDKNMRRDIRNATSFFKIDDYNKVFLEV